MTTDNISPQTPVLTLTPTFDQASIPTYAPEP